MKIKLIILFLITSFVVNAQKGIVVDYKVRNKISSADQYVFSYFCRIAIKDSLYYSCFYKKKKEMQKIKASAYGSQLRHHSLFLDLKNNIYQENSGKDSTDALIYEGNIEQYIWKLEDGTKKILGYTCKKSTTTFNQETIIGWYTEDLNYPFGSSLSYSNLPGLLLETEWINRGLKHTATKVEFDDSIVITPLQIGKKKKIK